MNNVTDERVQHRRQRKGIVRGVVAQPKVLQFFKSLASSCGILDGGRRILCSEGIKGNSSHIFNDVVYAVTQEHGVVDMLA